jgi:molybdenum cofactor cytidylyltransferase
MPQGGTDLIDRLIGAFDPDRGALIVMPTVDGKRGNPVLWSRRFFAELGALEGDVGARNLIGAYPEAVAEVAAAGEGVFLDLDTPEALTRFKTRMEKARGG